MKITMESDNGEVLAIVQEKGVEQYDAVVDLFRQASLAYGFHPSTVSGYFDTDEPNLHED